MVLTRFKVTKTADASGIAEVYINKTKDIRVNQLFVTLPTPVLPYVRDVYLKRPDGTVLGIQKASYCTSQAIGIVFPNPFILPSFDPSFQIDTRTILPGKDITIDAFYVEVDVQ